MTGNFLTWMLILTVTKEIQGQLSITTLIIRDGAQEQGTSAEIFIGDRITLEWIIQPRGDTITNRVLTKDGQNILSPQSNEVTHLINNAVVDDTGNYTLDVTTSGSAVISATITLVVKPHPVPVITSTFSDVVLQHGTAQSFSCDTTGVVSRINWRQNDQRFFPLNAEATFTGVNGKTLNIISMNRGLAGSYRCEAIGEGGGSASTVASNEFRISFLGLPPGPPENISSNPVTNFESSLLDLTWSNPSDRGFNQLSELEYKVSYCLKVNKTSCSEVTVPTTTKRLENLLPAGIYSVNITTTTTTNLTGGTASAEFSTLLCSSSQYRCPNESKCINRTVDLCNNVFDCVDKSDETRQCNVPKQVPLNVGQITSNSIEVQWGFFDNSERIREIEVYVDGTLRKTILFISSVINFGYKIEGLSPETNYTISVRAMNPSGYSVNNTKIFSTAPTPPPPSKLVVFPATSKTSITITWLPPPFAQSVTNFILTINSTANSTNVTTVELAGNYSRHAFENLMANTLYAIEIYAVNANGNGESSFLTLQTLFCEQTEFQCGNDKCISGNLKCNDEDDCGDLTDETQANCLPPVSPTLVPTPLYDGVNITIEAVPNRARRIVVVIVIDGTSGQKITIPVNETVYGIQRRINTTNQDPIMLQFMDPKFRPDIESTAIVYAESLTGSGIVFQRAFTTLGPLTNGPAILVSPTSSSLTIRVQARRGVSNATIVSYDIELIRSNSGQGRIVPSQELSATVMFDRLMYNTSYEVRYRVRDTDGYSEYSPVAVLRTKELELPTPPNFSNIFTRRNSIEVEWTQVNGQFVTGYSIDYKLSSANVWENKTFLQNESLSLKIGNLEPNQQVDIRIASVNKIGRGSYNLINATTDLNVCPGYDWKLYKGSCYYVDDNENIGLNSTDVKGNCDMMEALPTSILVAEESSFVTREYLRLNSNQKTPYIGLERKSETEYTWIDNSPFSYNILENSTFDATKVCITLNTNLPINGASWNHVACSDLNGYICKRATVVTRPQKPLLGAVSFDSARITPPKTTFRNIPMWLVHVEDRLTGSSFNFTSNASKEIEIQGLNELSGYSVYVQEVLNGLGPRSDIVLVLTRQFIPPSKPLNISESSVEFAESRQRKISWVYGSLGDSLLNNVFVRIEYCSQIVCLTSEFNGTEGILKGLTANTRYNFTVQVIDSVNMKSGMASDVMVFNASIRDTCMENYWHCVGSWKCIRNDSLCDNVFDCPFDGPGPSVDETLTASCKTPASVNVTNVIAGFNFIVLEWEAPKKSDRVNSYLITINNITEQVPGNLTTYRRGGLVNGSTIQYTIIAVNPTGNDEPASRNVTLPSSSAPTSPVVSLAASAVATMESSEWLVAWSLPLQLNNNDPNTLTYNIEWCIYNTTSCNTSTVVNVLSYTIRGLIHSNNYTVKVTVFNEFGQASPTEMAMFETPRCDSTEFQCVKDDTCILRNRTCNGVLMDCSDNADEKIDAGCSVPKLPQIEILNLGITFISIKYTNPQDKTQGIQNLIFTITLSNGTILETVSMNFTAFDKTVTFSNSIMGGIDYIVSAVAINLVGESNATRIPVTTPEIAGVPGMPRNITFTPTEFLESSSVEIVWQAPVNTGGVLAMELTYTIQYCVTSNSLDCADTRLSVSVPRAVVGGLVKSTNYTFIVTAYSSNTSKGASLIETYKSLPQDTCRNTSYLRCPVICLASKYVCDGVPNCQDNFDETAQANCSTPGLISNVTVETFWNALNFAWTAPTGFPKYYYLELNCTVNGVMEPKSTVRLEKMTTQYQFDNLTTSNNTATCMLSIWGENYAGNGTENINNYQTVQLENPSEPSNVVKKLVPGQESNQIELSWSAPQNNGNARANEIRYIVEWCLSSSNCNSTTVDTSSFIIINLNPATTYNISVTSVNPLGQRSSPLTFDFTTGAADELPSVPLNVRAVAHVDDPHEKVELFWDPPVNRTGIALFEIVYRVRYCIQPDKDCVTVDTQPGFTNVTLTGLESRQNYEISVAALGRNGQPGPFTKIIIHETDDSGLATWAIALIVIAAVIVLVMILALLAYGHFKTRYPSSYDPKSEQERAKMNPGYQDDQV